MNSDIALTPDVYTPTINDSGNYIDCKPVIRHGMTCPCGTRKDKVYETNAKFNTHTKSKIHQKWLQQLNNDKANHYIEMLKLKEINENQQKIISKMETDLGIRINTIDYLSRQLLSKEQSSQNTVSDLLDIDM